MNEILKIPKQDSLKIFNCQFCCIICLLFIVNCQFFKAQTAINLGSAIDTALKNNLTIKNEKLRSLYQQKLIKNNKRKKENFKER